MTLRFGSDGIDGRVFRLVCEALPRLARSTLRRIGGERFSRRVEGCGDWLLNKPNHLMQIFYMLVVNGSFVCFLLEVNAASDASKSLDVVSISRRGCRVRHCQRSAAFLMRWGPSSRCSSRCLNP